VSSPVNGSCESAKPRTFSMMPWAAYSSKTFPSPCVHGFWYNEGSPSVTRTVNLSLPVAGAVSHKVSPVDNALLVLVPPYKRPILSISVAKSSGTILSAIVISSTLMVAYIRTPNAAVVPGA